MGLLRIQVGEKHVLSDIDVHSLERDRAVAASYFDLGHCLSFRLQLVFQILSQVVCGFEILQTHRWRQ